MSLIKSFYDFEKNQEKSKYEKKIEEDRIKLKSIENNLLEKYNAESPADLLPKQRSEYFKDLNLLMESNQLDGGFSMKSGFDNAYNETEEEEDFEEDDDDDDDDNEDDENEDDDEEDEEDEEDCDEGSSKRSIFQLEYNEDDCEEDEDVEITEEDFDDDSDSMECMSCIKDLSLFQKEKLVNHVFQLNLTSILSDIENTEDEGCNLVYNTLKSKGFEDEDIMTACVNIDKSCVWNPEMMQVTITEKEIKTEKDFRKYAEEILQNAHKDNYDEEIANDTIEGLLKKYKDDYGAMIGALTSGFGG